MKISRTVAYALHATLLLGQELHGRAVPCGELANAGHMPERFLLQILRSLVTHGILNSERGVKGGYCLAKDLTEVSLLQVVEAVEGPIGYVDNPYAFLVSASSAKLNSALREEQEASRRVLDNLKLSQFSLKCASSLFG